MVKLLQNKHFVNTAAGLIKHCVTLGVFVGLFVVAPDQHTNILTAAAAFVLGGSPLRAKIGL